MNAIIDKRASTKTVDALKNLGYNIIKTPQMSSVYDAISCHPDIMVGLLNFSQIVVEPTVYEYFKENLPDTKVLEGKSVLNSKYPYDIAYNCAFVGNNLFCNEQYTDEVILNYCKKNNINIININQGYAKCSICVVSDDAIITGDKNIQIAANRNNIDVLLIENKSIKLKGFEYGFIGGATGKDKNKIFINGNVRAHEDADKIISFCKKHSKEVISLNDGLIEDIGSIFFI